MAVLRANLASVAPVLEGCACALKPCIEKSEARTCLLPPGFFERNTAPDFPAVVLDGEAG